MNTALHYSTKRGTLYKTLYIIRTKKKRTKRRSKRFYQLNELLRLWARYACKGETGENIARKKSGPWSAPCNITEEYPAQKHDRKTHKNQNLSTVQVK